MATLDRPGVKLWYEVVGAGEPVALVHGAVGSAVQYEPVVEELRRQHCLVLSDLRGMGHSRPCDRVEADSWTRDLAALADDLGLTTFHLVGVSLGARIAARYAVEHPDRVRSLTMDAPLLWADESADRALDHLLGPDMPTEFAEQVAAWQRNVQWEEVVSAYRQVRAMPELQSHLDLRDSIRAMPDRLLVTRGDIDDSIHPLEHALVAHRAKPSSWLWVAPDTRFSTVFFRPKQFAEVFAQFARSAG